LFGSELLSSLRGLYKYTGALGGGGPLEGEGDGEEGVETVEFETQGVLLQFIPTGCTSAGLLEEVIYEICRCM